MMEAGLRPRGARVQKGEGKSWLEKMERDSSPVKITDRRAVPLRARRMEWGGRGLEGSVIRIRAGGGMTEFVKNKERAQKKPASPESSSKGQSSRFRRGEKKVLGGTVEKKASKGEGGGAFFDIREKASCSEKKGLVGSPSPILRKTKKGERTPGGKRRDPRRL